MTSSVFPLSFSACSRRFFILGTLSGFSIFLSSCTPTTHCRGFTQEGLDFSKVIPGASTRTSVEALLGSPTSISSFPPETWYYLSRVMTTQAFWKPEAVESSNVRVVFNARGIVTHVDRVHPESLAPLSPVNRETSTSGKDNSVLREVFGNFGRFSSRAPTTGQ